MTEQIFLRVGDEFGAFRSEQPESYKYAQRIESVLKDLGDESKQKDLLRSCLGLQKLENNKDSLLHKLINFDSESPDGAEKNYQGELMGEVLVVRATMRKILGATFFEELAAKESGDHEKGRIITMPPRDDVHPGASASAGA